MITTRYAVVDGEPVVEEILYEQVPVDADGAPEDARARLMEDGNYWRWVSVSNPLFEHAHWPLVPDSADDLVWGSDVKGILAAPLRAGIEEVDEKKFLSLTATRAEDARKHAALKHREDAAEALAATDDRRARYKRNGWSEADLDAEFGPAPKKGR